MSGQGAAADQAAQGGALAHRYDTIIIGAGIAGLVAGWLLRDRRILVLESSDRTGGRVLSARSGAYWVNLGAHLIDANDGLLAQYADALEVPVCVPRGYLAAVGMRGRIIRASGPEVLPFRLPLSFAARVSLVRTGLRLRAAYGTAGRAHHRALRKSPGIGIMPADERLDEMTYADVLGPMHSDVAALMRVTANRMGAEPSRLSGDKGVMHTMGTWGSRRANVVGGTGRLTDAITADLGDRVVTNAVVRRVTQGDDTVTVEANIDGRAERLTAATCIVTVPAPVAREIVAGLSPEKDAALGQIDYGPYVVAGIFTTESEPMPWDDVYALATPDRSFSMAFNPANPLRIGQRRPGGSLVAYAAGGPAGDLLPQSDAVITERFLKDLYELLPALRGSIREVIVQRWTHGVPIAQPGRARLQPHIAAPRGRVFFAGDYMMEPGLDSSAWTSEVAVNDVRKSLSTVGPA
jgi:oxygen-dependent protoporphyrinogen oxidase